MACPLPVGGRHQPRAPAAGGTTAFAGRPPRAGRGYTELDPDMREAGMTLVVNVVFFAAIVLVPLGIAFLFIRLARIFSSR
jgi:hypothetical protein